jgi:GT2 family glycosyltransferase
MATVPVSIILLFYHRTPDKMPDNYDPFMMNDCVDSIIRDTDNYELIAVDNGSTIDESWIKQHTDKYIRFETNKGISAGWNAGIRAATHDHIIILSDDVVVSPGWVEALLEAIQKPEAGVSGVHVEGLPLYDGIKENYKWFPGMCFMLTKKTVKKVGYFDDKTYFPCNFEDTDYWTRTLQAGLKLYVNYSVTVQHRGGATLHVDDLSRQFEELHQKYIDKHGFDPIPYFYEDKDIYDVIKYNQVKPSTGAA